jgi:hypothetical protein
MTPISNFWLSQALIFERALWGQRYPLAAKKT